MTAFIAWGAATLLASTALMLLVLLVRAPVRHLVGPRLGYTLWALPALRMVMPPLPAMGSLGMGGVGTPMTILFAGPRGASATSGADGSSLGMMVFGLWLAGAVGLFAIYAVRHLRFCRRLRASGTRFATVSAIPVIAADVDGPLAFGVWQGFIAVPRRFAQDFDAGERDLALAHERAHHARGDLLANWFSLVALAAHWWNPLAWAAIRAFRDDQEFAADAQVLAAAPAAMAVYAKVLAKAAGYGALPVCNLNARSNLKGRLMMLDQTPRSARRLLIGGTALALAGGTALAATASAGAVNGKQAVTLGVKPNGKGGYALIIGKAAVASGAALPGGATLPADFEGAAACDLRMTAKAHAMVIKGQGKTRTYTVMCGSAAPAPVATTLAEGLTSLQTMRAAVATQPASAVFPETERTHALGAIDKSIAEVKAALG